MEFTTVGKTSFHTGRKMEIWINRSEDFELCNTTINRYRIVYIVSGNGVVAIDDLKFPVSQGCLILLNEKQTLTKIESDKISAYSIYFGPEIVNSALTIEKMNCIVFDDLDQSTKSDFGTVRPFLRNPADKRVFRLFEVTRLRVLELFDLIEHEATMQDNHFWPCSLRQYIIQLLFLIARINANEAEMQIEIPDASKELEKVVLYLHTYYHTKITLTSLANQFCTNRTTLSERFKSEFKVTIITYITRIRIQVAASLLKNTKLTIDDIANRIGFLDTPNFCRNFKKYMKASPGEYRQTVSSSGAACMQKK